MSREEAEETSSLRAQLKNNPYAAAHKIPLDVKKVPIIEDYRTRKERQKIIEANKLWAKK
jgi:hypothetical protein